jgi:predicted patatin/cPLA2 family phospholipase
MKKVGIIDVGGGMRDIYGAGIFDYLMDKKIEIPMCLGVSAGSANVASYVSKQKGRNISFYEEYSREKKIYESW